MKFESSAQLANHVKKVGIIYIFILRGDFMFFCNIFANSLHSFAQTASIMIWRS